MMKSRKETAESIEKSKRNNTIVTILVTIAIGSVIAFVFYVVERMMGYSFLAEYDEAGKVIGGFHLELVAISFSVTFLTTSLLGGLADKTEKIYWITYPDEYLIRSVLNFFNLSLISYLSIGVQTVFALIKCNAYFKDSIFMSAFIIGTVTIIILSYKFTSIYFNREEIRLRAEKQFAKWVDAANNGEKADEKEVYSAIMKMYNYTIRAAEDVNMTTVCENIQLLYAYAGQNKDCKNWIERLIKKLASENPDMFCQVLFYMDGEISERSEKNKFFQTVITYIDLENADSNVIEVLVRFIEDIVNEYAEEYEKIADYEAGGLSAEKYEKIKNIAENIAVLLEGVFASACNNSELYTTETYKKLLLNILVWSPDLLDQETVKTVILNYWSSVLAYYCENLRMGKVKAIVKVGELIFQIVTENESTYQYKYDPEIRIVCRLFTAMKEQLHEKLAEIFNNNQELLGKVVGIISDPNQQYQFCEYVGEAMADGLMTNMIDARPEGIGGTPIFNALKRRISELEGTSRSNFITKNINLFKSMLQNNPNDNHLSDFIEEVLVIQNKDDTNRYLKIFELLKDDACALYWYAKALVFREKYIIFFEDVDAIKQFLEDAEVLLESLFSYINAEDIQSDKQAAIAAIITSILIDPRGAKCKEYNKWIDRFKNCPKMNGDALVLIRKCLSDAKYELQDMEENVYNHEYYGEDEYSRLLDRVTKIYRGCIERVEIELK